ncbi:MAG TPA: lipid A biosynthesis acyltransferase [Ohtaekwangia sp.]|uniref:LpxL/LpxP family acyltransferase n=1 Tax=Ohtaekwangia sp. TaxID=2066019 RepID=UPI002F941713
MPQWQGKSKGNKLGYRIFVYVIRYLGVKPAYFLLRFVAGYYFVTSWSSSRHIYAYFRKRLHYGRFSSLLKIYSNYYVFGQTLLDKVIVMAGIENKFTYHFDGEENLRDIVKGGRGGILISGHVGNWEAAGHLLKRLNTRVNVVMFDGEHERIKQYLEQVTGGHNFNVIVIKNDISHVYAIGQALQNNELICLHADRFLPGNKTQLLSFLGEDALFPLGPFQLSAGFKVPVSIVFAFKESSTHYHFFGSKLFERGEAESKQEFTSKLMTAFRDELEQKVNLYPIQWFNYYNFWEK